MFIVSRLEEGNFSECSMRVREEELELFARRGIGDFPWRSEPACRVVGCDVELIESNEHCLREIE